MLAYRFHRRASSSKYLYTLIHEFAAVPLIVGKTRSNTVTSGGGVAYRDSTHVDQVVINKAESAKRCSLRDKTVLNRLIRAPQREKREEYQWARFTSAKSCRASAVAVGE